MSSSFLVVICLVQFCIILARNGRKKTHTHTHKSSYLVTVCYCVIDIVYIYSWKKLIKFWPIFVILYVNIILVFIARGVQLDNRVNPGDKLIVERHQWPSNFSTSQFVQALQGPSRCIFMDAILQFPCELWLVFKQRKMSRVANSSKNIGFMRSRSMKLRYNMIVNDWWEEF